MKKYLIKKCSKCQVEKSIDAFNKDKKTKDGLQITCRDCRKEYYKNNKKELAVLKKKYNDAHRKEIKE